MVRLLISVLVLDLLLLGAWLWKGPELLSPFIPRFIAWYLPGLSSQIRYSSVMLDHVGTITFRDVEFQSAHPLPLKVQIPRLRADLSFSSLRHLEPIFSRVRATDPSISLQVDSLPSNAVELADSLIQQLHEFPDLRVFENAKISASGLVVLQQTDTLSRIPDLHITFNRSPSYIGFQLAASLRIRYDGALFRADSVQASFHKVSGNSWQFDSIWAPSLYMRFSNRWTMFNHRDSLLAALAQPQDWSWIRPLHGANLHFENIVLERKGILLAATQNGLSITSDSLWHLQFSAQGRFANDSARFRQVSAAIDLPATPSSTLLIRSLAIDSLLLVSMASPSPFPERQNVSTYLHKLDEQPFMSLLAAANVKLGYFNYHTPSQDTLQAYGVEANIGKHKSRLSTGHVVARFHTTKLIANRGMLTAVCAAPDGCVVSQIQNDTLRIQIDLPELSQGPTVLFKEMTRLVPDPIWSMLHGQTLTNKLCIIETRQGLDWAFTQPRLAVDSPTNDSLQLQFHYTQWRGKDPVLLGGWLPRRMIELGKKSSHAHNAARMLDSLHFGRGFATVRIAHGKININWEFGRHAQSQADFVWSGNFDPGAGKNALKGQFSWSNFSLGLNFPTLFDQAFTQGLRIGGLSRGKLDYAIPLKSIDALREFHATGSARIDNAAFSGMYLQKQPIVQSKAPLYAQTVLFQSLILDELQANENGISSRKVAAKGRDLSFVGRLNARYDANFVLEAQASIPPSAADQLPILTRNGMEKNSDGGRKTPLSIYGTPYRQALSNQNSLVGNAVLNNLKSGFDLFTKTITGK